MTIKLPKWLILCLLAAFLSTGSKIANDLFEFSKNLEIFSAVYKEVGDKYVDELPPGKLIKTAITSMLASLDPYTVFFSEYQAEEALMEHQGEYGGVGCKIAIRDQFPVVTEIFDGYAFASAGIKLGDIILSHNSISLKGKTSDEMFQLFRGAPNTSFEITLKRGTETLTKKITRSSIKLKSVPFAGMLNDGIGYIKLDEFGQDCSKEIESELLKLKETGKLNGLILDLRDNGGGLLNEAVDIVRQFVGNQKLVVFLEGKNDNGKTVGGGPKNWITGGLAIADNLPLVVLINQHSASASEVVSGSLQDMDRAVIVGQTSFGKGLVQNYVQLPYRTQMKVTTARYHTPSGRCIQKLNYSLKDESGKATTKNADDKKLFRTANGRPVYEAGGIDPDVSLNYFKNAPIFKYLDKELILFDWANEFTRINNSEFIANSLNNDLTILNSFKNYSVKKTSLLIQKSLLTILKNQGADSAWMQKLGLFQIDTKKIEDMISESIQTEKSEILNRLKYEIMKRTIADKKEFYTKWLQIDPEISESTSILKSPQRINQILKK